MRPMSSQPSGSTMTISASGTASAMPDGEPAAAARDDDAAAALVPSCSTISRPAVPCPATIAGSSKLGTTVAPVSSEMRAAISSRLSGPPVVEDDLRALAARAVDLHLAAHRTA